MTIQQASSLRTIPQKKLLTIVSELKTNCTECIERKTEGKENKPCLRCNTLHDVLSRYYLANIPTRYWLLKMEEFKGDPVLLNFYKKIVEDVDQIYKNGLSVCLSGLFGTGKTMVMTSILKKFLEKGYSGLYLNLEDIIANIGDNIARQELLTCDLLILDEFDLRHVAESNKAIDLFGRTIENIIRHRLQNNIPIIFATNSIDPLEGFNGSIKQALSSLFNYVEVITVLGKDFRKEKK